MEEIVVSGKAHPTASEITIEDESIKIRSPGSAAELLSNIPGTSVTVGTKNSSEIKIRGFNSRDVLIMIDGRPVNDPYYGKIDLSTIGLGNISKIKVVKGSNSVRYGPNAMGGVVNIMTGSNDGPPVDLRITAGSGQETRSDVIHCGQIKNLGYRVHIGRNVSKGYPLSSDFKPTNLENGKQRNNSDFRRTDIGAKFFFGQPGNSRWSLNYNGSHLTKGLPSAVNEPRFWRFRNWDRKSIDLDGEPIKGTAFRVKTKLYAERFLNELVDYRDNSYNLSNVYYESTHDNRSAGILVSSAYYPGNNRLTNFGFQVRWDESQRQADKGLDWFLNRTSTTWVFAEHESSLTPNLLIRGGISAHMYSYDSWKRSTTSFDPSLYVEWSLKDYILTGALSRVSRFPTFHHLYSISSGNINLEPEWAIKGEVTVSRSFYGIVNCSVAGFTSKVHDLIYRSGRLGLYHNIEKASLDGVEVTGNLKLSQLDLLSAVTLLDARDGDGEKLEYRPSWKLDTALNWRIYPYLRIHITSRFVGQRWTEMDNYLKEYHVINLGISVFGNRNISTSINLKNILDVNYEEESGYPMAGRTIWIGIDGRWTGK